MASTKWVTIGPIGLTTTLTTNLFNPGTTTGGVKCTASPNDTVTVYRENPVAHTKYAPVCDGAFVGTFALANKGGN